MKSCVIPSIKIVIHLTIKVKIQHLNILKENSLISKTTLEKQDLEVMLLQKKSF